MEKKFVTPCKIRTYKGTFFHFFLDYNPKYVRIYITIINYEIGANKMSVWEDEWEDYELDKNDFEAWLDSLEGEGTDEEKYNREMEKQQTEDEYYDSVYENEIMNQTEYPEWMIKGRNYIMTVSNN